MGLHMRAICELMSARIAQKQLTSGGPNIQINDDTPVLTKPRMAV